MISCSYKICRLFSRRHQTCLEWIQPNSFSRTRCRMVLVCCGRQQRGLCWPIVSCCLICLLADLNKSTRSDAQSPTSAQTSQSQPQVSQPTTVHGQTFMPHSIPPGYGPPPHQQYFYQANIPGSSFYPAPPMIPMGNPLGNLVSVHFSEVSLNKATNNYFRMTFTYKFHRCLKLPTPVVRLLRLSSRNLLTDTEAVTCCMSGV